MEPDLQALDGMLKALADPTRMRIVGLLRHGEICVCHIHTSLGIAQPKASRHLAYLRRAGVVQTRKRGLWVYYRLATQPDASAQGLLETAGRCASRLAVHRLDSERLMAQIGCCPEPSGGAEAAAGSEAEACAEPAARHSAHARGADAALRQVVGHEP